MPKQLETDNSVEDRLQIVGESSSNKVEKCIWTGNTGGSNVQWKGEGLHKCTDVKGCINIYAG